MKKYFLIFIIVFGFLFAIPVFAQEAINDFSVDVRINKDSSLDVTENITYDFSAAEKHGIYRDITYKYKLASGNYNIRISDVYVDDENGDPVPFSLSNSGIYRKVKIGDPDKLVTGVKIYRLHYRVNRAVNFFDNYDEIYWNATGNNWSLPIKQVKAGVYLPETVNEKDLKAKCYSGPAASDKECLSTRYNYASEETVNSIVFISDKLNPGEGMTFVVGLPKNILLKPAWTENIRQIIMDNGIVILPLITLGILFYLWHTRGRDPEGRGTVIAEYEPPDNLGPAEVGTLIDELAQNKDISAEIVYLAQQGYLNIKYLPKEGLFKPADYELTKLKEADNLRIYQKKLLDSLFAEGKTVNLSDLKEKFYKDLKEIQKELYQAVTARQYFIKNPNIIRIIYLVIGIAVIVGGWFIGMSMGYLGVASFFASGIIIIIFSFFMPAKTKAGVLAKEKILGLKLYLSVAEKDRIKFHNPPKQTPEEFEKFLPYAMVLGVEKEWAKQFEGIYSGHPAWYNDPSGANFTPVLFASSLSGFSAKAGSALSSAPGGGSGFSGGGVGGGFGGGGGGSW